MSENIIFLDEFDLDAYHNEKKVSMVLVDHNRLASSQEKFSDCIYGSIIHYFIRFLQLIFI